MTEQERRLRTALQEAWPELEPDPAEMARVADLMTAALAGRTTIPAALAGRTAISPAIPSGMSAVPALVPAAASPGVAQFRLLTVIWAVAATVIYVAWPWLADWFDENPGWWLALAAFGILALLAPLLLLFVHDRPSQDEGGATPC